MENSQVAIFTENSQISENVLIKLLAPASPADFVLSAALAAVLAVKICDQDFVNRSLKRLSKKIRRRLKTPMTLEELKKLFVKLIYRLLKVVCLFKVGISLDWWTFIVELTGKTIEDFRQAKKTNKKRSWRRVLRILGEYFLIVLGVPLFIFWCYNPVYGQLNARGFTVLGGNPWLSDWAIPLWYLLVLLQMFLLSLWNPFLKFYQFITGIYYRRIIFSLMYFSWYFSWYWYRMYLVYVEEEFTRLLEALGIIEKEKPETGFWPLQITFRIDITVHPNENLHFLKPQLKSSKTQPSIDVFVYRPNEKLNF